MSKQYCLDMRLYPLYVVVDIMKAHNVDKRARVRGKQVLYALKNKKTHKWDKKTLSLEEAKRIVGELYG